MNTRILMSTSALFLALIGILLSFLPREIMVYLNIEPNSMTTVFLQILSGLYMGFGILNWMVKGMRIGGIYNRPIALGNLMHFGVGAIAFVKLAIKTEVYSVIILLLASVYVFFALLFAYVFTTNPKNLEKQTPFV